VIRGRWPAERVRPEDRGDPSRPAKQIRHPGPPLTEAAARPHRKHAWPGARRCATGARSRRDGGPGRRRARRVGANDSTQKR
jgi:hypothetical protein